MNPNDNRRSSLDDDRDALLAGHALGDLDADERERLASLLREQPELRQRLDQFRTTLELLPLALPATATPPARLRQRLLEPNPPSRSRLPWLVPALLGLGLLILGVELQQTRTQLAQVQNQLSGQQRKPQGAAVQAPHRLLTLTAMAPGAAANGEVLVTGNTTHNVLMLNDLPAAPPAMCTGSGPTWTVTRSAVSPSCRQPRAMWRC
ncbi:hypothetical protein [Cyanobium sp. ATX-6F1]|uniref:hypothetical protein n=1 Tax=Cyanobium sp. ATX-6F1 TaxID=3137388 RepID=UPI0039BE6A4F